MSIPFARAFTSADADNMFNSFNSAFYNNIGQGGNYYYKTDTTSPNTGSGWWTYAEEIEMAEDAFDRTQSSAAANMISNLCNDFLWQYSSNWTSDNYNDDITWAVLAFARAYNITGNTAFKNAAQSNFDAMYARAWSSDLGGGLWWSTDKTDKAACVNCPAAIAAYMLYQITGNSNYLTESNNCYNWVWNHIYNSGTGAVYDNMNSSGTVTNWTFTYNSGTFIGAAYYLGHTNDATTAATYVMNTMCNNGGLLPNNGNNTSGDGAGFNSIFLRWMAKFMKGDAMQATYLPWLQMNANTALSVRRSSDGLSWCNWNAPTPSGTLNAWGCADSVTALQVIPTDGVSTGTHFIISVQNQKAIDNGSSSSQGAGIMQWTLNGGNQQKWTFTQNSDTSWNIVSVYSGQALEVPQNSTANGTQLDQWTASGNANQRWWVDRQSDGSFKIWNKNSSDAIDNSSSSANGYKIIQWSWNGSNNPQQRWFIQ